MFVVLDCIYWFENVCIVVVVVKDVGFVVSVDLIYGVLGELFVDWEVLFEVVFVFEFDYIFVYVFIIEDGMKFVW